MELTAEKVLVSFKDQLKYIKYDSPAFRDKKVNPQRQNNSKVLSRSNITSLGNGQHINEQEEKNVVLPRYSVNEMVNVCYGKMWRGSSRNVDEENDICDKMSGGNTFPCYFERDLDKLQKLRVKSKFRARKLCSQKAEVRKWIQSPERFINILRDMRREEGEEEGPCGTTEDEQDNALEDQALMCVPKRGFAAQDGENKNSSQVHFPDHVLLGAALQEGDSKEVQRIISSRGIDLISLARATGYHYLHKTIAGNRPQCARVLVRNGSDVNEKNDEGISPLALAFRLANFPMVALLVDMGANIEEYTKGRIEELNKVREISRSVLKVFEMDV